MMRKIYKYDLKTNSAQTVWMPIGAKILSVNDQRNDIVIYAEVDPDMPMQERKFRIRSTGEQLSTDGSQKYLGTVLLNGGGFVVHVFEVL